MIKLNNIQGVTMYIARINPGEQMGFRALYHDKMVCLCLAKDGYNFQKDFDGISVTRDEIKSFLRKAKIFFEGVKK